MYIQVPRGGLEKGGGRGGETQHTLQCHDQNDPALRREAAKSQDSVHEPKLLTKKKPENREADRTVVLLLTVYSVPYR